MLACCWEKNWDRLWNQCIWSRFQFVWVGINEICSIPFWVIKSCCDSIRILIDCFKSLFLLWDIYVLLQSELPLVGNVAPDFEAEAVFDQEFIKVTASFLFLILIHIEFISAFCLLLLLQFLLIQFWLNLSISPLYSLYYLKFRCGIECLKYIHHYYWENSLKFVLKVLGTRCKSRCILKN